MSFTLAPNGIFTVEVKTLRGSYTLNETGTLTKDDDPTGKPYNVGFQSKVHIETLRRNLAACPAFRKDIPLVEIICSADDRSTITNKFHSIPVCYTNTIDRIIFSDSSPQPVLTLKDMSDLKAFLLEHQEEEVCYDVFGPRGDLDSREMFIDSFSAVAGGVICAKSTKMDE